MSDTPTIADQMIAVEFLRDHLEVLQEQSFAQAKMLLALWDSKVHTFTTFQMYTLVGLADEAREKMPNFMLMPGVADVPKKAHNMAVATKVVAALEVVKTPIKTAPEKFGSGLLHQMSVKILPHEHETNFVEWKPGKPKAYKKPVQNKSFNDD
jgi:hypothetical protein